jgi:hypothetical protein
VHPLDRAARVAGLFWFLSAVATGFGLLYVRSRLVVFGDAAETARNLLAHELLFRAGVFTNIVSQLLYLLLGLALFRLFREVDRTLSTALLAFSAVTVAVAVVNTVFNFGALLVLERPEVVAVFDADQRAALMMVLLRLNNAGQGVLEVFWTPWSFTLGLLVLKSRLLPRVLGVLLTVASVTFLVNVFAALVVPWHHLPVLTTTAMAFGGLSALPTMFWLMVRGAGAPGEHPGSSGAGGPSPAR